MICPVDVTLVAICSTVINIGSILYNYPNVHRAMEAQVIYFAASGNSLAQVQGSLKTCPM